MIAFNLIGIVISINSDKSNQFKLSRALGLTVPYWKRLRRCRCIYLPSILEWKMAVMHLVLKKW